MNNINITLTTKEANFIAGLLSDLIGADIELTDMTTKEVQVILNKLSNRERKITMNNSTLTTKEANFIAGLLNDLIEADIELTNMTIEEVQAILNKLSK